jgi:hypothetical protein
MALIRGAQLADAPLGVTTTKINDGAVTDAKVDGTVLSTNTGNAAPANDYTALGKKIINVADGTAATDAVNFGQLSGVVQGMTWKANVEAVTPAATALPNAPTFASTPGGTASFTATANTPLVVDTVNVTKLGQRVLVRGYSGPVDGPKNGIYELTQAGSAGPVPPAAPWILTRTTDMDSNSEVARASVACDNPGSVTGFGYIYLVTTPSYPPGAFVLNTSIITWSAIPLPAGYTAGLGIVITGLSIAVDITSTPSASGRGLTFVGNQLAGDIEPNKGLKFDDTTGRFEAYLALTPSVEGGLQFGANGGLAAKLEANAGLSIGANSGIEVKLETASPTGGGLQIGPNGGIEVKIDATSAGLKYTATGIAVNPKTAVAIDNTGGLAVNNAGQLIARVNSASGGLQINGTNEIEAKLEPSTPTTGGLQINGNGGIEAKLNGSGGLDYSATGLTAKLGNPANSAPGLSLSSNGIYNNVQQIEESGAALATAAQGDPVFSALTQTPFKGNGGNATIQFTINGVKYRVGPSAANDPIYYSGDGGVTARALNAIVAGDIPYRGGALGFNTLVSDEVNADYLAAVP